MKNFFQKLKPEWILRLGLGLMYLYSGFDLIMNPKGWTWALPWWYKQMVMVVMPIDGYLRFQGALELLMAFLLLSFFFPKKVAIAVAAVSSLEILFILLFAPQFSITFRDIGVLGASLALFLILLKTKIEAEPR
ncbi:MAG: hypothetical protein A3G49_05960 [Candidatus Sungbacteria bacterium RIFCSPLOWO2_12_FULL_41_11]|uniref:DoxX family protein n=1 Tax=Candidatus Sungbacteria bacterium RIFCSPLOWO2_12_FULL_41_11 TaxID=1802286 RepID=A0A1G2LQZ6_9BACT|nr:MAG: hypothetical protein A3G49_05960 [Candidatus Sungbacteria bacterium RIFCSPLOWO2_12_FULL_41_11]